MVNNKNNNKKEQFKSIRELGGLTPKFCENCGVAYKEGDAKIVHENPMAIVILFHCDNCGNSYLVNVIKPAGVASRVSINTDLSDYEEVSKFIGKHVSADDVIDIHNYLEDPTNDIFKSLDELLKNPSQSK